MRNCFVFAEMTGKRAQIRKKEEKIIFHQLKVGGFDENFSYILANEKTKKSGG